MERQNNLVPLILTIVILMIIIEIFITLDNSTVNNVIEINNTTLSPTASSPASSPTPTNSPTPAPAPSVIPVSEWQIERYNIEETMNYRDEMRWWVIDIAKKARETDEDFIIIPQNCSELLPELGCTDMNLANYFLDTISGLGNEHIVYGGYGMDIMDSESEISYKSENLLPALSVGKPVLNIDYCGIQENVDKSIAINNQLGYISYQSPLIELTSIPDTIQNENSGDIKTLLDVQNFIILINPEEFKDRASYIDALAATNYDMIIVDCYFNGKAPLTNSEVESLKLKANGGKRLVISYLSIGEAENYRPYWKNEYDNEWPEWILTENPIWLGNFPVYYWHEEWQDIIAFGEDSYLSIIQNAGFDGVYLDIVDGFYNFE